MSYLTESVSSHDEEMIPDTRHFPNGSERDDDWIVYTYGPDMFYNFTWREILIDGCGCGCVWPILILGGALLTTVCVYLILVYHW